MRELAHIPNLAGTKYTGSNMFELSQLVAFREAGWTIFSGMDEQALPGLQYGAAGVIGSTVNCMPGVYRELLGSYRDGDAARALDLQRRANSVTTLLVAGSFAGALRGRWRCSASLRPAAAAEPAAVGGGARHAAGRPGGVRLPGAGCARAPLPPTP